MGTLEPDRNWSKRFGSRTETGQTVPTPVPNSNEFASLVPIPKIEPGTETETLL